MKQHILFLGVILGFTFWQCDTQSSGKSVVSEPSEKAEKINGVSFVAPPRPIDSSWVQPIKNIHSDWVAIIPYAYGLPGKTFVKYGEATSWQWWGEQPPGVIATGKHAKSQGLKVMLKPQVWVHGSWPGQFDLASSKDWRKWESDYTAYIMKIARIADSLNVEMLCIGTEFKHSATKRPNYWKNLVAEVKTVYSGALTYAANWDCFDQISWWEEVDYIGIDAYFPLSDEDTPDIEELVKKWQGVKKTIRKFSLKHDRPVLFTEFGYRSIDKAGWKNWETEDNYNLPVNLEAQTACYQALFDTYWDEPWFSGGFLWKWYGDHKAAGGLKNTDYTPQNKPAESLISTLYKAH